MSLFSWASVQPVRLFQYVAVGGGHPIVAILTLAHPADPTNSLREYGRSDVSCPVDWSAPTRIEPTPPLGRVGLTDATTDTSRPVVLVGNEVVDWLDHLSRRKLVVLEEPGRMREGPPGDGWFAYPKAVFDRQGTLHVVWGEPTEDDLGPPMWAALRITSLWHSEFLPGTGWTEPVQIYAGDRVGWGSESGVLRAGAAGHLHLAFHIWPDGIRYYRRADHGGDWEGVEVETPGVVYSDLTVGGDSVLLAAFIGLVGPRRHEQPRSVGNSVYTVKSTDRGAQWSSPHEVQLSVEGRATGVRLLAGGPGQWSLLWRQNFSGGLSPEGFRAVQSDDGGQTWSEPSDLRTDVRQTAVLSDGSGRLHVVWTVPAPPGSRAGRQIHYACWDGGWSEPRTLFSGQRGFPRIQALTSSAKGLRLFWDVAPTAASLDAVLYSATATTGGSRKR